MIRILSLISLIVLIHTISFAQKTIDIVYLHNGNIIKGKILENKTDTIKIETLCRNIFVFTPSEISKIMSQPFHKYDLKTKGYYNFTSMGVLIGSSHNDNSAPFSVLMENDYRFNSYLITGVVTGIEMLNEPVVPLGITLKGILPLTRGGNLYAGLTGGYTYSLEKPKNNNDYYYEITGAYGGFMYISELGLIIPSGGNVSFFIAMGYRYNELNYKREDWQLTSVDQKVIYNRLSIRIGLSIH